MTKERALIKVSAMGGQISNKAVYRQFYIETKGKQSMLHPLMM